MTSLRGLVSLNRRHPRHGLAAGAVAVLLIVAIGGCDSEDSQQASARKAQGNTTAPTTTTAAPTTTTAPEITTPPTTVLAATEPPPTEPSTDVLPPPDVQPPPVCLNSTDHRCGDFRWDPTPTNQPVTIDSVVVDPPHPIAGQTVTVTIHWSDPDVDLAYSESACNGAGTCDPQPAVACPFARNPPTGSWSPPPPGPGAGTLVEQWPYEVAGTFTWSIRIATYSSAVQAFARDHDQFSGGRCGGLPDPYSSYIEVSDPITVNNFPSIPG